MGLYELYERHVFPHIIERAMRRMGELRDDALARAEGDVLEVGFGTGLNLRHYPPAVKRLSALDPMTALDDVVAKRIAAAPFPVERFALRADGRLPFDDESFDTVVVTWTLCTIPDVATALREMRRVLRPSGRLLFIEHGLSDKPSVARWQHRLNPIQNVVGCGCNLDRKIDALVAGAGFALERVDRFVAEGAPEIFGTMYRGSATRG